MSSYIEFTIELTIELISQRSWIFVLSKIANKKIFQTKHKYTQTHTYICSKERKKKHVNQWHSSREKKTLILTVIFPPKITKKMLNLICVIFTPTMRMNFNYVITKCNCDCGKIKIWVLHGKNCYYLCFLKIK